MENERINTYEGFFLFPQAAASDLQGASDHIKDLLARAGAEIISFAKWDERRLAFEINGNKRGIYFLAYFKAQGDKLVGLERDCNLSEQILRFMVTRADLLTDETIQAADGQQQLADEISLRGEKAATMTTGDTSRIESKSELVAEAKASDAPESTKPPREEKKTEAKAEAKASDAAESTEPPREEKKTEAKAEAEAEKPSEVSDEVTAEAPTEA